MIPVNILFEQSNLQDSTFIHFIHKSDLSDMKKNGLMTAQALYLKGNPKGSIRLRSYIPQIKRAGIPLKDQSIKSIIEALSELRETPSLEKGGADWFYGISGSQFPPPKEVIDAWDLRNKIAISIDLKELKMNGLLINSEYTNAKPMSSKKISKNIASGYPALQGILHPRILIKDGIIPPKYLKVMDTWK